MRNRVILAVLTLAVWIGLKSIDDFVTGPEVLILLSVAVAIMITHSVWLMAAQGRWRRKARKAGLVKQPDGSYIAVTANPNEPDDAWKPWVDIFIAAKNEQRVIESTVRNFFKLDYESFYLWVIDDCSTDETPFILERLKNEFPRLRVLNRTYGSCPGKSAALNEALPLAKGEVVAVFDADAYVAPNFFAQTLPVLDQDGVGAVQAQKRIFEHQTGMLVDCQASEYAMDTHFQMGRDLIGGAVELRGNGQLIKRAALIDVGGWNNKAITDDLDLSMRLLVSNWDVRFVPHAYVWEEGVPTVKGLLRQRRRWAEGSIRRYLDYIFPLNSPTRLSLVERLDTIAFTVYFVVPALMFLEVSSELMRLSMGVPTYGKFFALISLAVFVVSQLNLFVAIRIYRNKMSIWRTLIHSFQVSSYVYAHWVPVIFVSFCQIIFGKQTSTWHPTEHVGAAHSVLSDAT
jgi:1,2-diacylglycerol 3-beta-glucosyltransferase